MAIVSVGDLTFSGDEIKSAAEAVFESVFYKPEIEKFHTLVTEIVQKKQIVVLGRLNGLVGAGNGSCDPASGPNTITMSQKFWTPEFISDSLEACWVDLDESFWAWGLKKGIEKTDLTNTDFLLFVEERLNDAIVEAIFRFAWFGDTTAATTAASPPGVLTAGTTLSYFNRINGFWKQIFAIVAADSTRKTTGLATKNAASTFALQAFNTTDTTNLVVSTTLENMGYEADERLEEQPTRQFIVTKSVFDQYKRELKHQNLTFTTERLENGIDVLKSDGIEIFKFSFWDRIIKQYYSNGTKYYLPHRIVLATPENLQIGTEDKESLTKLKVFNDAKSEKNYIRFGWTLDAKIILDYEIQVAY